MQQVLQQIHRPIIFTPYKIRNQIINEDKYNRDIDNFAPKDQLRILQSYMPVSEIKQRLIHQKQINAEKARLIFNNIKNSHKSNVLNAGLNFHNIGLVARLTSGFDKTGLKQYYQFESFYLPTATFTDNFVYPNQGAADAAWPTTNTANVRVNITNNNLAVTTSNGSDTCYHDLTSISDTAFTFRYKVNISNLGSSGLRIVWFILSSNTSGPTTTNDSLGIMQYLSDGNFYTNCCDGVRPDQSNPQTSICSLSATAFWAESARLSATLHRATIFSDAYLTPLGSKTDTVPSTVQTLRYQKLNTYTGSGGTLEIDDYEFYNSVYPVLPNVATAVGSPDSIGTNGDQLVDGLVSIVTGKINNAYLYDGSTGYTEQLANAVDFGSGNFTINLWVYKTATTGANHKVIMQKGHPTTNNAYDWRLYVNDNGTYNWNFETIYTTSKNINNADSYSAATWYMITIIKSGTTITLYKNDSSIGSVSSVSGSIQNSYSTLMFTKANVGGAGQQYFNGRLDEVSIFTRAITGTELSTLYNSGNGQAIT